jgi:hypothetical protein
MNKSTYRSKKVSSKFNGFGFASLMSMGLYKQAWSRDSKTLRVRTYEEA